MSERSSSSPRVLYVVLAAFFVAVAAVAQYLVLYSDLPSSTADCKSATAKNQSELLPSLLLTQDDEESLINISSSVSSIESEENSLLHHSDLKSNQMVVREMGPIFYNLFVPPNERDRVIGIAKEQMQQRDLTAPNSTLLYTLIGDPNMTDDFCQPNCKEREYLEKGDEIDTYHAMWKYCHSHKNEIVTYIHDRGSFHPSAGNTKSRRFGTKAALECRSLMLNDPKDQCNVCVSYFTILPQYLSSANMWTAQCSYISSLQSPKVYPRAMIDMYKEIFRNNKDDFPCLVQMLNAPGSYAQNAVGIARYAPERWIHSHPDVRPCSVMPIAIENAPSWFPQETEWQPLYKPVPDMRDRVRTLNRWWVHKLAWNRLAGRLFEWNHLYGKEPPADSWIWQFYKDFENGDPSILEGCRATIANLTNYGEILNVSRLFAEFEMDERR